MFLSFLLDPDNVVMFWRCPFQEERKGMLFYLYIVLFFFDISV